MKSTAILIICGFVLLGATMAFGDGTQTLTEAEATLPDIPSTHEEIDPLDVEFKRITSLRLHPDGNLLACDGEAKQIKVISPKGKLVKAIDLEFGPEAIDVAPNGTIYCGGQGKLVKLDKTGKELAKIEIEDMGENTDDEFHGRMVKEHRVSGLAIAGNDLFVAFGSGWSLRSKSKLFRFDADLKNQKLIAEQLRGCCQRCDVASKDGEVYIAENAAYRVVKMNREGESQDKWGSRDRTNVEGFGACCNPMNICFDAKGNILTAESGLGRVKCYSPDGKFVALVGYVGVQRFERASSLAASCSNIAIDITPDGRRVYVMDYKGNMVRVLEKK